MSQATIGLSTQTLVSRTQAARWPQYLTAFSATIGGFVMGTVLGWTNPVQTLLQDNHEYFGRNVTKSEFSLMSGLGPIGAMFGSLFSGPISNVIGRRTTMLLLFIPSCVGWALLIWAKVIEMMHIGRFILGAVAGAASVVAPLYTTEIAQVDIRGTLGTFFQLQCTLGILFASIFGIWNVPAYWVSVACFIIPFIYCAVMFFMPESPYYLLDKGKEAACKSSLERLRGKNYDVSPEVDEIKQKINQIKQQKVSLKKAFTTRAAKVGLAIGLATMFFQQFSGINAIVFYSKRIFKDAGSTLSPGISAVIINIVMVLATFVSTLIIDRLGRKPLLLFSDAFMTISIGVLGVYFYLSDHHMSVSSIGWLPILCLTVFIIVFSIGFGPIPWMFMSEIFAPEIVGPASSIASLFNWLCAFIVTAFFEPLQDAITPAFSFWLFAIISAIGTVFVFFFLPETKGKSLDEIQVVLGGKKTTSRVSADKSDENMKPKY